MAKSGNNLLCLKWASLLIGPSYWPREFMIQKDLLTSLSKFALQLGLDIETEQEHEISHVFTCY